jgi:hypothetical protein
LRKRREEVIEILCESFARDQLEEDQFEQRIDLAHRASELAALDTLVADLNSDPTGAPGSLVLTKSSISIIDPRDRPQRRTFLAILGGTERRGSWRVPAELRTVCCMGGTVLDFREAQFAPGVTELRIFAFMGGCEIIVPPDLAVECDGNAILGGFASMERSAVQSDPDRPLLHITGFAIMGGVEISTRLPGESERQARRRRRREQRDLRDSEHKRLQS